MNQNRYKLFVILLVFICTSNCVYSQVFSGVVLNIETQKPIATVNVYLDGTSFHTTTDAEGKFRLEVNRKINTPLIISHVAFETESINDPYNNLPEKVYLKKREIGLNEAVVKGKMLFSRKKMLAVFRKEFLGDTKAGASCEIENEDDINLRFDSQTNILYAFSEHPVIVINKYLGYKISFQIKEFAVFFKSKTLNHSAMDKMLFYGPSSYTDIDLENLLCQKRRMEAYKYSFAYFMKNLANKTQKKSRHDISIKGMYSVDPDNFFNISDTLSMKKIQLIDNCQADTIDREVEVKIYGIFSFSYKRKRSQIIFLTDSFFVDQSGNTNAVDKILLSGFIGEQRLANMLPLDYTLD